MSIIIMKYGDEVVDKYPLTEGQTLTIGRKESNDIVVEALIVSGSHAKIDFMDEGFLVTDLRSKNGTYVNGERVTSQWLKNGDVVTIGKHQLILNVSEDDGMDFEIEEDELGKTMILESKEELQEAEGSGPPAVLSFLKGGQGEIPLDKKLLKIGKDFSNDIVISGGFTVGQTAATISRMPDGFYLSYVGGMSKPKLNGKPVSGSRLLSDFDNIEIGAAKLQFFIKEQK